MGISLNGYTHMIPQHKSNPRKGFQTCSRDREKTEKLLNDFEKKLLEDYPKAKILAGPMIVLKT